MNTQLSVRTLGFVAACFLMSTSVLAESVWVSDQFEVMLRTGPDTSNAIERMLSSGTRLEVMQQDADSGYSRVQTQAGTEGWVLTRYLMQEPSAREQLTALSAQLSSASERGSSMSTQMDAIRNEQQKAASQIQTLQREKSELESELAEIKRTAANVLAIDNQNQKLQQQLTEFEIQVGTLENENSELATKSTRNWFIAGALVLFGGVLLGLILPRMRWQKRSGYDTF
jgi:SH3 domain protein